MFASQSAEEVLSLLPANQRDSIQPEIVDAQLRSGELAAALETATAISTENARAAALLLVVQAQAKSRDFGGAMRTAALIAVGRVESVQALVGVAKEQKQAGKRGEATQLLQRATAAAANLTNSNEEATECGLSVLARIANAQESMGELTEAVRTLRLAGVRVQEADPGCRFGTIRYLQDEGTGRPEALQNQIAEFRRLLPSAGEAGNEEEEENEEDSSSAEAGAADSMWDPPLIRLQQLAQNQQPTLRREEALAVLDSLRRVKPLYRRAHAAMEASHLMLGNGKADEGEEAIHIGLEAADTIQDENLRGMLLALKAQARAAAKDWKGAHATVEEIGNAQQRTAALVDIAFCAAEDGQAQLALSWANAEASPLSAASVLVSIAEALLHQPQEHFFIR